VRLPIANASRWQGEPGHYEAWHLRMADPASAASAWIRLGFTVPDAATGGDALAEVWFVGRDAEGELYARREMFSIEQLQTGAGGFPVTLGRCVLESARAAGRLDEAAWDLTWDADSGVVGWGGESRVRRSELVASQPAIRVTGTVTIGETAISVQGWPAQQLHAWGSRRGERSARVHCNQFAELGDFVEAVSRRYLPRRGRPTPVVTTGAARLDGVQFDVHDVARGVASHAAFGAEGYEFAVRGARTTMAGTVTCSVADLVGVVYRDPDGGRIYAYQADRARMEVELRRRGPRGGVIARAESRCAYEFQSRRAVSGVEVVL
jgi:hypothetical protein